MSDCGNTKKRRVGDDGTRVSIDGSGSSGGGSELAAIKSMMQELVQQNRTQTNMMQSMQGEIARLTNKCDRMERDNKRSALNMNSRFDVVDDKFDVVEDKLKYHDILLQNQHWEYSAPRPTRAEYWDIIGAAERSQAEDFLSMIQECTEKMRYGTSDGEIELTANLPYDGVFLPHWEEFSNALEQYHYHLKHSIEQRVDVSKLRLLGIGLPDKVIDLLSKALKSTHFQYFTLRDNNFGQKGIDFVLDYLESNTVMKWITLVNNPINNMDDINKLCKIIKDHPSIENLALDNCKGGDINGYEMLTKIMNAGINNLIQVDLARNGINTKGGTAISDFLATNPILETLDLSRNELNDNDAIDIAKSLKHNS